MSLINHLSCCCHCPVYFHMLNSHLFKCHPALPLHQAHALYNNTCLAAGIPALERHISSQTDTAFNQGACSMVYWIGIIGHYGIKDDNGQDTQPLTYTFYFFVFFCNFYKLKKKKRNFYLKMCHT